MSALDPTAQEVREILKARARALAREREDAALAQDTIQVIEFVVADERYAIELDYVRGVHSLEELVPLPGTPPFVLGIVNLRGRVTSVIDIKKFFDLPERGLSDLDTVIVIGDADMEFAILADRIVGTASVARSGLQPSLPTLEGIREQYLKGVSGERLVVLAADKLLSDPRIVVREEPEN